MTEKKSSAVSRKRRSVVCGLCALSLNVPSLPRALGADSQAASSPPRENDLLVYAYGDRAGEKLAVQDMEIETKQIFAWAMDPDSGVIRNGSRLNQLVVIRLDPGTLTEETAARAAAGVVAYSGVCSHTGCDVTDWNSEFKRFQCPCHESQFDPRDAARVVGGPAPWQLAALPLKESGGVIAVAGEFAGRVGFQQPGLSPFGL